MCIQKLSETKEKKSLQVNSKQDFKFLKRSFSV